MFILSDLRAPFTHVLTFDNEMRWGETEVMVDDYDFGFYNKTTLRLVKRDPELHIKLLIYIGMKTFTTLTLECDPSTTIEEVKTMIQDRTGE